VITKEILSASILINQAYAQDKLNRIRRILVLVLFLRIEFTQNPNQIMNIIAPQTLVNEPKKSGRNEFLITDSIIERSL